MVRQVRDEEILLRVAVDVSREDRRTDRSGEVLAKGLEGRVAVAAEDHDGAASGGRRERGQREVDLAVVVEVGERDRLRPEARGVVRVRLERAVPVVPQHGDRILAEVGGRQVQVAVAVEVRGDDLHGTDRGREGGEAREVPVAVTRQHGDRAHDVDPDVVRDREIEVMVPVEIAGDDSAWTVSGGELRRRSEGPVAVPEENRHRARALGDDRDRVDDRQIRHAVLVEIAERDGLRVRVGRVGDRGLERAVAVAEKDGDRACSAGS